MYNILTIKRNKKNNWSSWVLEYGNTEDGQIRKVTFTSLDELHAILTPLHAKNNFKRLINTEAIAPSNGYGTIWEHIEC